MNAIKRETVIIRKPSQNTLSLGINQDDKGWGFEAINRLLFDNKITTKEAERLRVELRETRVLDQLVKEEREQKEVTQ